MFQFRTAFWSAVIALGVCILPTLAHAAKYGGGGLLWGVTAASVIVGPVPLRIVVLSILSTVLSYMAMIALIVIVAAGIVLVVGSGEDAAKDRTKKMILYTIIGLIIIGLAEAIVWILKFTLS